MPDRRIRKLAELAELAGVSTGTVSRALAGNPLVNPQTRERIQQLAREHNFRPNQMASRLRTQRTGMIGIVVPLGRERRRTLTDPFFGQLFMHLADNLTESGYDIMLSRVVPDDVDWLDQIIASGLLDGVVLLGQSDQFETIERVAAHYRPLVAWGGIRPGQVHCAVGVDDREGGRMAGRALIERGCRNIAYFGEVRTLESAERFAGLADACADAGIVSPGQFGSISCAAMRADRAAIRVDEHLDAIGDNIDGIFACCDTVAQLTVKALLARGKAVPGDVAVIGFDDLPLASQAVRGITTIRQDLERGAREIERVLLARIAGEDVPSVTMTPVLVRRDTA